VSQIRLWLRVAPSGAIEWLCRDERGRVVHGPGGSELPASWPRADQVIVVWADESLVLRRAPLPASGRAKWRIGLPYLAEDWVAGDIGDLHVVAPLNLAGSETWVAVVERRRLDDLLGRLRELGLEPDRILPEAAFLGPERGADVLLDGGHASFATGGLAGGCEADLFPMVAGQPLESLRVLATGGEEIDLGRANRIDSVLRWVSLQPLDDGLVDLRQGDYAPAQRSGSGAGWWRIAAVVALVAVGVHTVSLALEVWSARQTEAALVAELEADFRRVFGADERMVDPAFQIRTEFSRIGPNAAARNEALALLKGLAPMLTADSRLVLQGFVYGDGALEVAIRAPDATRFEGLREQIMLDATLQVEIGSTSYEGQEVIGRIRIRRSA
jgi:type II secretion system protein L